MRLGALANCCCVAGALLVAQLAGPVAAQTPAPSGAVITIAGNGMATFAGDGGPATSASFNGPLGMAVGPDGTLYIADASNFRIRSVDPTTGIISTVAGTGPPPGGFLDDGPNGDGGPATSAQIGDVPSLTIDRESNTLYLPAVSLFRVRQVNLATGIIDNFAGIGVFDDDPNPRDGDGGPATSAYLPFPFGVAAGPESDVFITDDYRLRRVDGATGIIHRVAGIEDEAGFPVKVTGGDGGPASGASFAVPSRLRVDNQGNVFVIDAGGTWTIRRIDAATGIITRIAGGGANLPEGGGPATDVNFTNIQDIALDDAGHLFIAHANQIFELALASGQLASYAGSATAGFAGDGGPAGDALFFSINGLSAVPGGGLLVADTDNQRIRYIAPDSINLVGDAGQTEFHLPWVSSLTGDLTISSNPNMTGVNATSLISVTGSVNVANNASLGCLDLTSLQSVGGNVTITDNGNAAVNVSLLANVNGNVTITDNGNAAVNVSLLANVTGSVTLETTGTGSLELGGAAVGGATPI
jgi:streptogramin lyase